MTTYRYQFVYAYGLPTDYACARFKCGWHCRSNNTSIVLMRDISMLGKISALFIVPNCVEANIISHFISSLALAFDIGSTKLILSQNF